MLLLISPGAALWAIIGGVINDLGSDASVISKEGATLVFAENIVGDSDLHHLLRTEVGCDCKSGDQ